MRRTMVVLTGYSFIHSVTQQIFIKAFNEPGTVEVAGIQFCKTESLCLPGTNLLAFILGQGMEV